MARASVVSGPLKKDRWCENPFSHLRVQTAHAPEAMMLQSRFPEGWDEERVRKVLRHYQDQTEEEAVAEDEAGYED